MKKLLVIVAVALVACSFSSCKKVCTCGITVEGITVSTQVDLEKDFPKGTYKNCAALEKAMKADVETGVEVKCK